MRTESGTEEHRSAPLTPWRVTSVEALPGSRLSVRFAGGLTGQIDLGNLIHGSQAGVFARLADPQAFNAVFLEDGAVTWDGGLDLAPDAMHDAIRQHGVWTI